MTYGEIDYNVDVGSPAITPTLLLSVMRRSPIVNNEDQIACANCDVKCDDWCLRLRQEELNQRWIKYFR